MKKDSIVVWFLPSLWRLAGAALMLLFLSHPCLARAIDKTELPPGDYEYLQPRRHHRWVRFSILNDKTAVVEDTLSHKDYYPLSVLKAGRYNRLFGLPGTNLLNRRPFKILPDGRVISSDWDEEIPFDEGKRIKAQGEGK